MACPTCGHTMEGLGYELFHCSRCGSLLNVESEHVQHVTTPKLVTRCREFQEALKHNPATAGLLDLWHRLAIEESINVPVDR